MSLSVNHSHSEIVVRKGWRMRKKKLYPACTVASSSNLIHCTIKAIAQWPGFTGSSKHVSAVTLRPVLNGYAPPPETNGEIMT